jgi:hypothetical protein
MHPPNKKSPRQDDVGHPAGANQSLLEANSDNATEPTKLQERHICRLYAVSFATAATIARLAYSVAQ